jgi:hypothetical protein
MNEFLNESRSIKNNSGLVGRLINSNSWDPNISVKQLNTCIDEKIIELETQRKDIHNSNKEAIEVKKILGFKKSFPKDFYSKLHVALHIIWHNS